MCEDVKYAFSEKAENVSVNGSILMKVIPFAKNVF